MYVLGFDIGGTKCAVVLAEACQEEIHLLDRLEIRTVRDWRAVLEELCAAGLAMLKSHGGSTRECAAGVSCGGPLDAGAGIILSPPNLPGWDEVPVVSYLEKRLSMPVRLKNDADACALAEWKYGAGKGCRHMIFLTFGTGLGAGLILNGQLYSGVCGMAGEAGHIRIEKNGPVGYGKAGSLEGFCSGGGIGRLAQQMAAELEQEGKRASYAVPGQEITAKAVAMAAAEGQPDALEVFRISGMYFGRGLAVLIDLLNPERIIVGSVYARAGQYMKQAMEEELKKETLGKSLEACRIVPAMLGEEIGDYASAAVALY